MTSHSEHQNRLSDYLDGALDEQTRHEVQRHIESCPECHRALEELRIVRDRLRIVARTEVPAAAELMWPPLRRRMQLLQARRRRARRTIGVLLAAGILLMAAGLPIAWWRGLQSTPENPRSAAASGLEERSTLDAVDELRRAVDAGKAALDPATAARLERSLATVDSAIADTRTALTNDPSNAFLVRYLSQLRAHQVSALRDAAAYVRRGV
jgi:predicted anti-sigma-YlaC factor YlaD